MVVSHVNKVKVKVLQQKSREMQFHIVLGLISADGKWHVCTQGRLQHHLRSISPPCSVLTKVSAYAMQLFQKSQPEGRMGEVWPTRAFFDGSNRQFRRGERQRGENKDFLFTNFWLLVWRQFAKFCPRSLFPISMIQCSLPATCVWLDNVIESFLSSTVCVVHVWVCWECILIVYLRLCLASPTMYILSN